MKSPKNEKLFKTRKREKKIYPSSIKRGNPSITIHSGRIFFSNFIHLSTIRNKKNGRKEKRQN